MGRPRDIDVDAELLTFEEQERLRLGVERRPEQWTDAMVDPFFGASERPRTTLLVGGLTLAHDFLIEGALRGIGYHVRALDCPDAAALRYGKEFGNRGQCNPTYYTVGNLVKELERLRTEEGLEREEIIQSHVFVTAGACGPCRFGMYVTEYRKALRDAGYDGFRVLLFQQTGGLKQATGEALGLVLDPTFFIALAKALIAGDVINAISYRIRPYEVEEGAADRAIDSAKREVYDALAERRSVLLALRRGRRHLAGVVVDRTSSRPKVSILGEFWAMTTEGEGNYFLQRFVEQEGGECDIQLIANLLLYNLWEFRHDTLARAELRGADSGKLGLDGADVGLTLAGLYLGEGVLRALFGAFAWAIGLRGHVLPDMDEVARAGADHYDVELRGGEGHLEVAKLILNVVKQKAHMTISVKPFGCMPSSGVSDGVQSAVTELYPDAIFCAVETSGDGAVNFHSRVQMFLFKARQRAEQELSAALEEHGVTRPEVQRFLRGTAYGHSLYRAPHRVAGSSADLVHHVAPLMGVGRLGRAAIHARRFVARVELVARRDAPAALRKTREVAPWMPPLLRYGARELREAVPNPRETWSRLLGKAVEPGETQKAEVARMAAAEPRRPAASTEPRRLPLMA